MKKLILGLFVLVLAACGESKENKQEDNGLLSTDLVNNPRSADGTDAAAMSNMARMEFTDTTHDFGTITEGETVEHEFEFTNTGKEPLIISNAGASCGCTVPDYPREPIQPGQKGMMKVKFNSAGKPGHQEKSVTVTTNSNRGTHMLFIKAEVKEKK